MKRLEKFEGFPAGWPEKPIIPSLENTPSRIMVGGVGGTGVVTLGALLGMAAHLEGKATRVMDMAGLAQKGGTVYSYVQLASDDEQISATKIPAGQCDILIGADAIVAGSKAALSRLRDEAVVIVNEDASPTLSFIESRDWYAPITDLITRLKGRVHHGKLVTLPAARIATQVLGDSIYTNQILLGMAWQSGKIPLLRESIEKAIQLNGTAVDKNIEAFRIGCHLSSDPSLIPRLVAAMPKLNKPQTMSELIEDRTTRLREYWNEEYALKYKNLVERAAEKLPESLAGTIATQLYRVMAYKDEYEVARLLTAKKFKQSIASQFGEGLRLTYHLAPPVLGAHQNIRKRAFGYWIRFPLMLLARLQWLRETFLDPFARQTERQHEQAWRDRYISFVEALIESPEKYNLVVAEEIAKLPAEVRGFGHVKAQAMNSAIQRWDELTTSLNKS